MEQDLKGLGDPTTGPPVIGLRYEGRDLTAAILDAAPALIVALDRQGRFVHFNRACRQITGYSASDLQGKHLWDSLLIPEEIDSVKATFFRLRDGGAPAKYESHLLAKDGGRRLIAWSATALADDRGDIEYVVSTGIDISGRKDVEEGLQERTHDLHERIKELNCLCAIATLVEDSDLSLDQVIQGTVDLVPPAWQYPDITCARITLRDRDFRTRGFVETEWRQTRDITIQGERVGTVEVYYLHAKPPADEGPFLKQERCLLNVIAVRLGRIIERKQDAEEKAKLEEHLHQAQKMEAIGQLAGGVAHDFNNLLTVILCSAERLKRTLDTEHDGHEAICAIGEATQQAIGVTRSLLTFSRNAPAKVEPICLSATLQDSVRLLTRTMPTGVQLVVDDPRHTAVWVKADAVQLHQILLNLALNARDAMPHGGTLRVSAAPATRADLQTWKEAPGLHTAFHCLTVSDTGTGMTPEIRERIFEPFFTTKPRGQGTGLGLAMVQALVREHGGHVSVETEPGKGTTFRVLLPRLVPPPTDQAQRTHPEVRRSRTGKVLLGVQDPHTRGIVAMALESLGYDVVQAGGNVPAKRRYEQGRDEIHALVLDALPQSGPKPDGPGTEPGEIDWLADLRRTGDRTPAILLADDTLVVDPDQLDDRTRLLQEPFKVPELAQLIDELIADGQTREDLP